MATVGEGGTGVADGEGSGEGGTGVADGDGGEGAMAGTTGAAVAGGSDAVGETYATGDDSPVRAQPVVAIKTTLATARKTMALRRALPLCRREAGRTRTPAISSVLATGRSNTVGTTLFMRAAYAVATSAETMPDFRLTFSLTPDPQHRCLHRDPANECHTLRR